MNRDLLTWIATALQFLAAGAPMIWSDQKLIGTLTIAIGLLIAVAAAVFYHTKEIRQSLFMFPVGLGVGLLVAYQVFNLHPSERNTASVNEASLLLQFSEPASVPVQRKIDNISSWYAVYTESITVDALDASNNRVGNFSVPPRWVIFILFDGKSHIQQLAVRCAGARDLRCSVQHHAQDFAVITASGDTTNALMEVYSVK